ncbi:uncharacterized protein N7515_004651 [Penicillium bovifimosum]|uniref:RGS domain-containing protein n=1 Tax=Penicillium bovifimosum TaxID=126998 RepID=A0A9W9H0X4_9EURO|nr:uncharacterized protein N7515_004651 [Penicillium bovifimosum]KAJ5135373.1 hypothetical protein N7515_004651 [Penicillium bovifimosum]
MTHETGPASNVPSLGKSEARGAYRSALRPTLDDVLSDTMPPPYTLSEFIAYLSQKHCLETLEFIVEANRYRETYNSLIDRAGESTVMTDDSTNQHLRTLCQLLLTTYLMPGAPREVNLPVDVSDALLRRDFSTPLPPEVFDPAVKSIRDLMEDSIFVAFLNSRPFLCEDPVSEASNRSDVMSYRPVINSGQSTTPVRLQAKRPSLNTQGRNWTWPPWRRQAN